MRLVTRQILAYYNLSGQQRFFQLAGCPKQKSLPTGKKFSLGSIESAPRQRIVNRGGRVCAPKVSRVGVGVIMARTAERMATAG